MSYFQSYTLILMSLIVLFLFYNYVVYSSVSSSEVILKKSALRGENLWQQNNCSSCHQIYGLGGYLGPDMTNTYSQKGEFYIKAFLNSGIKAMPKFNFTEQEQNDIVAFLSAIDKSGTFPNKKAIIFRNGWVDLHLKSTIDSLQQKTLNK